MTLIRLRGRWRKSRNRKRGQKEIERDLERVVICTNLAHVACQIGMPCVGVINVSTALPPPPLSNDAHQLCQKTKATQKDTKERVCVSVCV